MIGYVYVYAHVVMYVNVNVYVYVEVYGVRMYVYGVCKDVSYGL